MILPRSTLSFSKKSNLAGLGDHAKSLRDRRRVVCLERYFRETVSLPVWSSRNSLRATPAAKTSAFRSTTIEGLDACRADALICEDEPNFRVTLLVNVVQTVVFDEWPGVRLHHARVGFGHALHRAPVLDGDEERDDRYEHRAHREHDIEPTVAAVARMGVMRFRCFHDARRLLRMWARQNASGRAPTAERACHEIRSHRSEGDARLALPHNDLCDTPVISHPSQTVEQNPHASETRTSCCRSWWRWMIQSLQSTSR